MYQNQAQHTLPHTPWITNTCFCRVSRSLGLFLVVEQKQTYIYTYIPGHALGTSEKVHLLSAPMVGPCRHMHLYNGEEESS